MGRTYKDHGPLVAWVTAGLAVLTVLLGVGSVQAAPDLMSRHEMIVQQFTNDAPTVQGDSLSAAVGIVEHRCDGKGSSFLDWMRAGDDGLKAAGTVADAMGCHSLDNH